MNTVVHRRPPVAATATPVAPQQSVAGFPRRPTLSERWALRLAVHLIAWSARHRASASPAVSRARSELAAREIRERRWERERALTIPR